MASDVFFMNDRASNVSESLILKAVKVFRDAGLAEVFKPGDTVGVKLHMGELGNSLNLRPAYVRNIVDEIKRSGGKPVVVDCNTLPFHEEGSRANAADHLWVAARHGFTEETMGCPIWIADGEYGEDDVKVAIPHGVFMTHSYIGRKILDLDAMIVVSHFKGHSLGVFGGAIKNVGIGCGSKRGKICTHLFNHPVYGRKAMEINQEAAAKAAVETPHPNYLERMIRSCPFDAMSYENGLFKLDRDKCTQCMACLAPSGGTRILRTNRAVFPLWATTIADACAGYLEAIGPVKVGYLSYAVDVTPTCDCAPFHDRPLVPNFGVFASKDPVAIDMACLDMEEALHVVPGSKADDFGFGEPGAERFTNCSSLETQPKSLAGLADM